MNVQNGVTLPKHRNAFDHLSELDTDVESLIAKVAIKQKPVN